MGMVKHKLNLYETGFTMQCKHSSAGTACSTQSGSPTFAAASGRNACCSIATLELLAPPLHGSKVTVGKLIVFQNFKTIVKSQVLATIMSCGAAAL